MSKEFGCNICNPKRAEDAWEAFKNTKVLESLIDESHFSIQFRDCRHCDQRYLSVFTETIDWNDGQDPQLWSIIPIEIAEFSKLRNFENEYLLVESLKDFAPERKSLCFDWPKGSKPKKYWSQGVIIGLYD